MSAPVHDLSEIAAQCFTLGDDGDVATDLKDRIGLPILRAWLDASYLAADPAESVAVVAGLAHAEPLAKKHLAGCVDAVTIELGLRSAGGLVRLLDRSAPCPSQVLLENWVDCLAILLSRLDIVVRERAVIQRCETDLKINLYGVVSAALH